MRIQNDPTRKHRVLFSLEDSYSYHAYYQLNYGTLICIHLNQLIRLALKPTQLHNHLV